MLEDKVENETEINERCRVLKRKINNKVKATVAR